MNLKSFKRSTIFFNNYFLFCAVLWERREGGRAGDRGDGKRELCSAGSFPKWPHWLDLGWSEASSHVLSPCLHVGIETPQHLGHLLVSQTHLEGLSEVEHWGFELAPICYAGTVSGSFTCYPAALTSSSRIFLSIIKSHMKRNTENSFFLIVLWDFHILNIHER